MEEKTSFLEETRFLLFQHLEIEIRTIFFKEKYGLLKAFEMIDMGHENKDGRLS